MPDMAEHPVRGLEGILKDVQEGPLHPQICEEILKALESDSNRRPLLIEKLLEICIQEPKGDGKNSVNSLNVVSNVLSRVNIGEITPRPDLVPSMLKILNMIKTSLYNCKFKDIQLRYFEVMLSYPDDVYVAIAKVHCIEILELFSLYLHQRIIHEVRIQPINMLLKLLKVLPPDERTEFVIKGIDTWFLKLVPNVMVFATIPNFKMGSALDSLEIVANELLHIDYADNLSWQLVLQSIYTPQKYPAVMKNLLENGSDIWHRLWIVFIKMLKSQITKSTSNVGSPINSMLPVVETAFKMDVTNRCRAFCCWIVLIDNFSAETNEAYINKRIKLLLIPLCSNNAKVEDTALAKLKAWWHLIYCFHTKIKNPFDVILMPFLQFCFGKPNFCNKPSVFIPGLLSEKTKKQCVEALVNLLGHHNCAGCVIMPKLNYTIINTKHVEDNWTDLLYFLNMAIKITAGSPNELRQPLKCAWISFVNIICQFPDVGARKKKFHELFTMLEDLLQNCHEEALPGVILNDLILSLFNGDDEIKQLMKLNDGSNEMSEIFTLLLNSPFERLYKSYELTDLVGKLKSFSNFVVEHCCKTAFNVILRESPTKYNSLVLWTALTTSLCEKKVDNSQDLCKILLWPLRHVDLFTNMELSVSAWHTMYDNIISKTNIELINDDVLKLLKEYENINSKNISSILNVSMLLLMKKIAHDELQYDNELGLIQHILSKTNNINSITSVLPKLIDLLSDISKKLAINVKFNIAEQVILLIKVVFMLILLEFKKSSQMNAELLVKFEALLKHIDILLKVEAYTPLKQTILTALIDCSPYFGKQPKLKSTIIDLLSTILSGMDSNSSYVNVINNIVNALKQDSSLTNGSKFSTPDKLSTKKHMKKKTTVVNTVVENGEEFVVLNSNWKFNPKKLTDKQKEKFQRQREDIPALYQDLSQSQDEFKLRTWKTDSQDTTNSTSTSSKSNSVSKKSNEEVSSILKNMPNTDIVPKILKNILTENNEKANSSPETKEENMNKNQTPNNKEIKTPRLALKDRVLHNVRNLVERLKHNVDIDNEEPKSLINDITKTPTELKTITANALISPHSDINLERPSRVRRKPKKFEDLHVLSLKRRRHSLGISDSQNSSIESYEKEVVKESECDNAVNSLSENQENQSVLNTHLSENTQENQSVLNTHLSENTQVLEDLKVTENENILINGNKNKNCDTNNKTDFDNNKKPELSNNKIEDSKDENIFHASDVGTNDLGANNENHNISESQELIPKVKNKSTGKRKSRIEKELAIDMVPFKVQSEKRLTRKNALDSPNGVRRKSVTQKLNKSSADKICTPKIDKKSKDKDKAVYSKSRSENVNGLSNSQESSGSQDVSASQDFIESSQDSTISIKSTKVEKRIPIVALENIELKVQQSKKDEKKSIASKVMLDKPVNDSIISNCETKDTTDIYSAFFHNKTATEFTNGELTEDMETQPMISPDKSLSILKDFRPTICTNKTFVEMDTQDIADADTQPMDPNIVLKKNITIDTPAEDTLTMNSDKILDETHKEKSIDSLSSGIATHDVSNKPQPDSLQTADESSFTLSGNNEEQRKQDFINNTLEISPIKTLSPVREDKTPSPETSSDYMVIKLSSPVQSNGEPIEKCTSPEIFTDDKVSPDKRDQSPPRKEVHASNASPKSLSLKKNKPQVRAGGRAAQMLGLCVPVPERLQTKINSEKPVESDEQKKCSPMNTSARRNLRILYNSTNENSTNNEVPEENEQNDNFLKLKRTLPSADSSPSVPILKRKLVDIIDDSTVSPASKRKRVSFHDPPVSTTVCVKKYIEPCGVRSPQNSLAKRQERQLRSQLCVNMKSQKRLDIIFKYDTPIITDLANYEIDSDIIPTSNEDSEINCSEQTPLVELVKNSELNNVDPICMDLIDCKDPIDNIAGDLSSSAMRPLLVKEFAGKIETVGDLAKMSELEVNRLCIKAPKVEVTKKVLNEYAKAISIRNEITPMLEEPLEEPTIHETTAMDIEIQTDCIANESIEVQTETLSLSLIGTQTDKVSTVHCITQTDESGNKTTANIVTSLLERADYNEALNKQLDVPSKLNIAKNLSHTSLTDILIQKLKPDESAIVIDKLLEQQMPDTVNGPDDNPQLSFMLHYLNQRFSPKDLILLCSDLLKKVHDKNF